MKNEVAEGERYPGEGALAMLACDTRSLIHEMREYSKPGTALGSREMSCAITNIEQGLHWLLALQLSRQPAENTTNEAARP